mmetsp:Transcript_4157/g.6129  ORF Transcript_4157/g.6129 Transcript_4157/m.6129 type:complete len:210 (+) Transcript_4157:58-687(+)
MSSKEVSFFLLALFLGLGAVRASMSSIKLSKSKSSSSSFVSSFGFGVSFLEVFIEESISFKKSSKSSSLGLDGLATFVFSFFSLLGVCSVSSISFKKSSKLSSSAASLFSVSSPSASLSLSLISSNKDIESVSFVLSGFLDSSSFFLTGVSSKLVRPLRLNESSNGSSLASSFLMVVAGGFVVVFLGVFLVVDVFGLDFLVDDLLVDDF